MVRAGHTERIHVRMQGGVDRQRGADQCARLAAHHIRRDDDHKALACRPRVHYAAQSGGRLQQLVLRSR